QAEDGIRDFHVTGVQTCALPIFEATAYGVAFHRGNQRLARRFGENSKATARLALALHAAARLDQIGTGGKGPARASNDAHEQARSEERRGGKECRSRAPPEQQKE